MYQVLFLVGGVVVAWKAYIMYEAAYQATPKLRAKEQDLPKQERRVPSVIKPTVGRPMENRYGYVGSALSGVTAPAHPLRDLPEAEVLNNFKSLNIANRYLYG